MRLERSSVIALFFSGVGTVAAQRGVQHGVDDDEREALCAEGFDPDDPTVVAAVSLVQ